MEQAGTIGDALRKLFQQTRVTDQKIVLLASVVAFWLAASWLVGFLGSLALRLPGSRARGFLACGFLDS